MRLGVLFVYKVHVVGAYELDTAFLAQLNDVFVYLYLQGVYLVIRAFSCCLVQLELKVIVVAKKVLEPHYNLLGFGKVAILDELRDLTTKACRAADQPLVIFLNLNLVGTRVVVVTFAPCL